MSKTQQNMYNTVTPLTVPKKRRYNEANRSTSFKKNIMERSSELEPPHLAATFTRDFRK